MSDDTAEVRRGTIRGIASRRSAGRTGIDRRRSQQCRRARLGPAGLRIAGSGACRSQSGGRRSLVRSAPGLRSLRSGSVEGEGGGARIVSSTLQGAVGHRATLDGAQFTECDLSRIDLRDCVARESRGEQLPGLGICLAGATLAHAVVSGLQFSRAVLSRAKLREVSLTAVLLEGAVAAEADFTSCRIRDTDITSADRAWRSVPERRAGQRHRGA